MIVGLDVDGILADFNASFVRRIIAVTGRNLFPAWPFEITTWDYPETYGYTKAETSKVWDNIRADHGFWASLEVLPGAASLVYVLQDNPNVYFITSRPGLTAKSQTEFWLRSCLNRINPTVMISSDKGASALALDLDVYIDDKNENCLDVQVSSPDTDVFMLAQPWNQEQKGIPRLRVLNDFIKEIF